MADLKLAGWGALGLAVLASWVLAFHLGGSSARAAAETAHAAQLAIVVTTLETQRNAALTESNRRQGIIDAYDIQKSLPVPAVTGLGARVYVYSHGAGCGGLPGAGPVAGGATGATSVPGGDTSPDRLLKLTQSVYDACAGDAAQMRAMIEMASPVKAP